MPRNLHPVDHFCILLPGFFQNAGPAEVRTITNTGEAMKTPPSASFVRRPQVRLLIRFANILGSRLREWGLRAGDLSEAAVLEAARRQTGLEDLGDPRFLVPLRALLASYDSDPELTFVGRLIAQGMMVHHVANRMWIHQALKSQPEALEAELSRPLFVVGLPRTGTTLLYNLLLQDTSLRPLHLWESMFPVPPTKHPRRRDPRIRDASRTVARLNRAAPRLRAIHEMDPRGPDECLGLLLNTFVTPFFRGRLPQYRSWLYEIPPEETRAAYEEYRRQLLLLTQQGQNGHWVLKCPSHLFGLGALLETFPDARVVQMHRDPAKAVPSLCSLTAALDAISYRTIDHEEIGRRDVEIVDQLVTRGMHARQRDDDGRVYDLLYQDLVRDPLEAVRRVHAHFGHRTDDAFETRVEAHLAANPRHKHGAHRYRLEDFRLRREDLYSRFAEYCERFGIMPEED